jgi:hypothetical protein
MNEFVPFEEACSVNEKHSKESHVCKNDITQQLTTSEPENPALDGGGGQNVLRIKKDTFTVHFDS